MQTSDSVRMRMLRAVYLDKCIAATMSSLSQAQFRQYFTDLPVDVSTELPDIKQQYIKAVQEDFERIVEEKGVRKGLNHLDDLIAQSKKKDLDALQVLNAEQLSVPGIDSIPTFSESLIVQTEVMREQTKRKKLEILENKLKELEASYEQKSKRLEKAEETRREEDEKLAQNTKYFEEHCPCSQGPSQKIETTEILVLRSSTMIPRDDILNVTGTLSYRTHYFLKWHRASPIILSPAEMKHITASVLFLGCLVALCGADDVVRRPSGIPTFVPPSTNFSGPAFLKWAFKQNRTSDGYLHVGVQQGEYDVYTNGVPMFEFSFVNNITFWLDDVILTFRTRLSRFAVQVGVTENIAIRGMTVHFNPPEMTQAIIDNITQVNSYTWIANATVCDGYPTAFVPGPKTWYIYSGKTLQPTEPFRNCFDLWIPSGAKVLSSDGKKFQLQLNAQQMANNNVNVGDILATRGSGVTFHGIYESRNFSFIDVTITGSGAFGWYLESGYGGHVFQRVKIMRNPNPPIPGGVPPVLSLSSDGLHVVGMKNGPIVIDSLFEGMGDDGINLLNWYVTALSYPDSTTIVAKPPTYWSAGDIVRLYAANLEPLGFSRIISITVRPDKNSTIVLTTPHGNATYISDRSNANANFVISNNTFYNHRARSILCKGSRGVISNNVFNLTSLGAIFIATGPGEGDYSTDLTVANNYLENIGASSNNGYGGSITVNLGSTYVPLAGAFINISIVNNTVKGSWGRPLTVYSTVNSSIIGNQFVAPFRSSSALITLQNNAGLIVLDNCANKVTTPTIILASPNTTTGIQHRIIVCEASLVLDALTVVRKSPLLTLSSIFFSSTSGTSDQGSYSSPGITDSASITSSTKPTSSTSSTSSNSITSSPISTSNIHRPSSTSNTIVRSRTSSTSSSSSISTTISTSSTSNIDAPITTDGSDGNITNSTISFS
ncbi:hypothetical protein PROFUN_00058 [Planoprotostelium fungivorum]|uniref:Right handed beta helix domain-containing protein n=1 Tax=Planoprotostelium fungivorum TaxID=1890364 RepID=A0A2P6P0H9_9EUKA|nr:hypothetical protein PROFUN_00058 [Planoprotostelium fungivorum]